MNKLNGWAWSEYSRWGGEAPWYGRVYFRTIIDPVRKISSWWEWKVDSKIADIQNAGMRVKHGHDWVDRWNMNSWFIRNAIPILDTMIEKGMGFPTNFESREDWEAVLIEMRDGFKVYAAHEFSMPELPCKPDLDIDNGGSGYKNGGHYMEFDGVWCKTTMDNDDMAKLNRALELFKEHFLSLWD